MRTKYELLTAGSIIALCGFGPCEQVALDRNQVVPDTGADGAGGADESSSGLSTSFCYFTSYPTGSKHCIVGPCSLDTAGPPTCSVPGYNNYLVHGILYGTYLDGQAVAMYPNPQTSFPECRDGAAVNGEPSSDGSFYGTGLPAGSSGIDGFCAEEAPVYSTKQCYFASNRDGARECITGPCDVTNAATAIQTCHVGSDFGDVAYLLFARGTTLYATYEDGQIIGILHDAALNFRGCIAGATVPTLPSNPDDHYATGLVVGEASSDAIAEQCDPQ